MRKSEIDTDNTYSKIEEVPSTRLKKLEAAIKKREKLILWILASFVIVCVVINFTRLNEETSSKVEYTSIEEEIEFKASFAARMHYTSTYDAINLEIKVASVRQIGNNWRVAGKVFATDEYGDTYSANWSITYNLDLGQIDTEYGIPSKNR